MPYLTEKDKWQTLIRTYDELMKKKLKKRRKEEEHFSVCIKFTIWKIKHILNPSSFCYEVVYFIYFMYCGVIWGVNYFFDSFFIQTII